jgi:hypothetical protein
VSDLDHIRRRLDALLIGTRLGHGSVVVINDGKRMLPSWPLMLTFVNAQGRRRFVASVGDEELGEFLDRVVPQQRSSNFYLAVVGGMPIEPQ